MTNQHSFVSSDRFDRDPKTAERVLNAAIVRAEITEGFEEYLEIFDAFYGDHVEVSSETERAPIRGKAKVRSLLFDFLVPLHVMAEVGGLSISIRETAIPGDTASETHSAWTLDLIDEVRTVWETNVFGVHAPLHAILRFGVAGYCGYFLGLKNAVYVRYRHLYDT